MANNKLFEELINEIPEDIKREVARKEKIDMLYWKILKFFGLTSHFYRKTSSK